MNNQTARARVLRRDATPAENLFWQAVRNRGLAGAKARRQMQCGPWIADYGFPESKLIVEIDGDTHATAAGAAHDRRRTAWLTTRGWRVLRFSNRDVLGNLDGVLGAIAAELSPHPNPLPEGERELPSPSPTGRGLG